MAGRKAFVPTKEQRDLVSQLAAMGTPQADIRKLILKPDDRRPVSIGLLERVFRDELDTGALKANAVIAGALFNKAKSGDTACMIFWLKTRAKWREVQRFEHTGADGKPIQSQDVPPPMDLTALSEEELQQLENIMRKAGPVAPLAIATTVQP
jgi:hypothetical protein